VGYGASMDEIEQRERESRKDAETKFEQQREAEEAEREELADELVGDDPAPRGK
jgi:hypothetical protein